MHIKRITPIVALLLILMHSSLTMADSATTDARTSTSIINGQAVESEYPSFTDTSSRADAKNRQSSERNILNIGHGLWIYDLLIDLTVDNDADGHYSTFSITLDIDNSFSPREVYAVFYLSQDHGPWFEYAVTGNFTVSGNSSNDSISIETSLETGYPNDYYDLYAEIYDANTGALLLTYGPNQSGQVIAIPFESEYDDSYYSPVTVQLAFSGSGSISWFTLLFFASLLTWRAVKRSGRVSTS